MENIENLHYPWATTRVAPTLFWVKLYLCLYEDKHAPI
jgi:hypothetical protein